MLITGVKVSNKGKEAYWHCLIVEEPFGYIPGRRYYTTRRVIIMAQNDKYYVVDFGNRLYTVPKDDIIIDENTK